MKKFGLIVILIFSSFITSFAQKLGDYIELDGVPAFVIYVDESGEHGLVMSMPAMTAKEVNNIDKNIKNGRIASAQSVLYQNPELVFDNKKSIFKYKTKEFIGIFEELTSNLTGNGENNAKVIDSYCKENNISMKDVFPWQYWAKQLGDDWFIPGDDELELFAKFYMGGLDKEYALPVFKFSKRINEVSDDEKVRYALMYIIAPTGGLISSTAKFPNFGFRMLATIIGPRKNWLEIIDGINGVSNEKLRLETCAVRWF